MSRRKRYIQLIESAEETTLKEAFNHHPKAEFRQKANALLMSHKGLSIGFIAQFCDVTIHTVGRWFTAWEQEGLVGLMRQSGQGRKPILKVSNKEHIEALDKAVESHYQDVKGIQITDGLRKPTSNPNESRYSETVFKKNHYTWRRVRRCTHKGQDKVAYQDAFERWQLLLTLWVCGYIELYFSDESGFTMQPYVPYAWQKKGETVRLFARNQRHRLNVLGFMSLDNKLYVYNSEKSIDACFVQQATKDFLQQVEQVEQVEQVGKNDKPIVIVWDNSPIHHAKLLKEHREQWEKQDCFIFYLPKYSPHLNPIEIMWRRVKYKWLKKENYKSWAVLKKVIFSIFKAFGSTFSINFNELLTKNMSFNFA